MRLAVAMLFGALGTASCVPGEVDLEGKACPCLEGWVCDALTETCVRGDGRLDAGAGVDAGRPDAGRDAAPGVDGGPVLVDAGPSGIDAGPTGFDAGADGGPTMVDAGPRDAGPPPLDPPWWDTSWGYRARITVSNTASASAVAGLPVVLMVDVSALPMRPARSKLSIARWDSGARTWTDIDYMADRTAAAVTDVPVWFALVDPIGAGASDTTYWLHWDTASPDDFRTPNGVFPVWHSFFSLPGSGWVREDPMRLEGDELVLEQGGSIRSAARYGPGYAVDYVLRVPTFSGYFWGGYQRESDFVDSDPWMIWINRTWDTGRFWPEVKVGALGHTSAIEGSHLTIGTGEHHYSVERFTNEVVFVRDYAEIDVLAIGADYANPLQVRLRSSPESGPEMFIDWVRIRPVMRPMPTVTLGSPVARP